MAEATSVLHMGRSKAQHMGREMALPVTANMETV